MNSDENVFNFDVSPFEKGLKRIDTGFSDIEKRSKQFTGSLTGAMNKAVNGLITKVIALGAAFKGVKGILNQMPEVGQAFGIAKDVFLKNLLFPLRMQVMPLLQKMLDWVRDNRAQFTKWGVVVANVFKSVVIAAKELWQIVKYLVDTVANSFQSAFRTNFKSFDEFLNVFSFKVAAVVIYLGMLAKSVVKDFTPAFDWIINESKTIIDFFINLGKAWGTANANGDSFFTLIDKLKDTFKLLGTFIEAATKGLSEGFLVGLSGAMTPVNNFVTSLNELLTALGFNDTEGVRGAFKSLGTILGSTFVAALSTVAIALDTIVTTLMTLAKLGDVISKLAKGDWSGAAKSFKETGSLWTEYGSRTKASFLAPSEGMRKEITANELKLVNVAKKNPTDQTWQELIDYERNNGIDYSQNMQTALARGYHVHDAIITKEGKIVRTDPDDNIYAFKKYSTIFPQLPVMPKQIKNVFSNFSKRNNYSRNDSENNIINTRINEISRGNKTVSAPSSFSFGPFYVTVAEGNAEQTARSFGNGLYDTFRSRVDHERIAEGF